MKRAGFIGTGHLAGFFVEGLRRVNAPYEIVVSPRNAERSAALARDFGVSVAADNQAVVDQAALVILSVLPQDAERVLESLEFRQGQTVLSVMAGVGHSSLQKLVSPAEAVISMMPGMANAYGIGPSVIFPDSKVAREFLAQLGPVHGYGSEAEFTTASVMGAFSGMSMLLMRDAANWFEAHGLDRQESRRLVAETLRGNAQTLLECPLPVKEIAAGVATPGGITELGHRVLESGGTWPSALDAVLKRIRG